MNKILDDNFTFIKKIIILKVISQLKIIQLNCLLVNHN